MSDPKPRLKKQRHTTSQIQPSVNVLTPVVKSDPKSSPRPRTPQLNNRAQLPQVSAVKLQDNFSQLEARVTLEEDYDFLDNQNPSNNELLDTSSDISSSSEDEDSKHDLKPSKIYKIPRKSQLARGQTQRETLRIFFDSDFRREDTLGHRPVEIDARIKWLSPTAKAMNNDSESGSECEWEIAEYISEQAKKKKMGLNVTGETFWYDPDRSLIRNLHTHSVSITSYEAEDKSIFGRADILHPTLTAQEKKMLGIRSQNLVSSPKRLSTNTFLKTKVETRKMSPGRGLEETAGAGDGFKLNPRSKK